MVVRGLQTTFVDDLPPRVPIAALDAAPETVRRTTRGPLCAIAIDVVGAQHAADVPKDAPALTTSMAEVTGTPATVVTTRQLAGAHAIADVPQALSDVAQRPVMTGCAQVELAQFRTTLVSLRWALDRLRIIVETTPTDVKVSIANVLALRANALSPALIEASQDLQLIIDALEPGSRAQPKQGLPAPLEAARQEFRELVVRHRLHAELFTRAKTTTCNALARMMLANVALMITLAVKSRARAIGSSARQLEGCSPRALSGPMGEPEV